ncbi:MAG TPA: peptidoglycan DD-metalloendopeptidase family protein [Bacteroidales bacterium]|nr:peptidoglycan DD-metalloendopeptidase family protein [Bacteroidales bacterium]
MKEINMKKKVVTLLIISALLVSCSTSEQKPETLQEEPEATLIDGTLAEWCMLFELPLYGYVEEGGVVKKNENFSTLLQSKGIGQRTIFLVSEAAKEIFDMRRLKAGNTYSLLFKDEEQQPSYLIYRENFRTYVCFSLTDSLWVKRTEIPLELEEKYIEVTIDRSLWQDLKDAGFNPLVANGLSEVFAWTTDFFGLQKGDVFRACYQAYLLQGEEVDAGHILTASFSRGGTNQLAFRYVQDSVAGYWDQDGVNLQRAFLKAPLKYSRISSGFSYARKHPITRVVRPHTGVDYAAPAGTPVMSIGEGTVVERTYTKGGGNTIKIKHNSVYTTAYLHLSRFAPGLTTGKRVAQGEVIGYVGSTGMSTGPHLDFRVWKNGKPINPLTMESPPADPIGEACMADFLASITPYRRFVQPEIYKETAFKIMEYAGLNFLSF